MKHWVFLCGSVLVLLFSRHGEAAIVINEILADPHSVLGDANRDGRVSSIEDEFIELMNLSDHAISLDGWSLADAVRIRHVFSETSVIAPRGLFVVFGGGDPQGFADFAVASTGTLSLNNAGDHVVLMDASGNVVDEYLYGPEGGRDTSLVRSPDGVGDFVLHNTVSDDLFSPGWLLDTGTAAGDPAPVIPEPSGLLLMGLAYTMLGGSRFRR